MSRQTTLTALIAGVFIMSAPMHSQAQQASTGYIFSDTLKASLDAFRSSQESFRSGIDTTEGRSTGPDRDAEGGPGGSGGSGGPGGPGGDGSGGHS